MLLLTKLVALGIVIWFYMAAEKNGQPPIKWAVIGLIGYVISWFIVDFFIDNAFSAVTAKSKGGAFFVGQIPVLGGLLAAYFIKNKLVHDAKSASEITKTQ
jgi:uncharacterized membrane protein YjfL (UPF0719 family)